MPAVARKSTTPEPAKAAAEQAAAQRTLDVISIQVDELGDIEKRLAPYRLDIKREDDLRKKIRAHFDEAPAEQETLAYGKQYICVLGPRANESIVDVAKLIKTIGMKAFAAIAKVSIAAIKATGHEELIRTERTGARSLRVFETPAGAPKVGAL